MRWRGSVGAWDVWVAGCGADWVIVFRSAHGSSNAMREWMGETKRKR